LEKAPGRPIVVETTGLAVAGAVADTVEKALREIEPGKPRAEIRRVIGVVDAPNYGELKKIWPAAHVHLLAAADIIVNKMDLLTPPRLQDSLDAVRRDFPQARLWPATRAEVDLDVLLSTGPALAGDAADYDEDSTRGYRSAGFRVLAPLDLVRLQNLLDRHRKSVVRAKGIVRLHRFTGWHEVQWSGGLLNHAPHDGGRQGELVVIGRRVPWSGFLRGLDACGGSKKRSS
jgi:G3E family GTPase